MPPPSELSTLSLHDALPIFVGSLLRPPDLLEARAAVESGRLSAREFKRIEDRAVDEAVRLQEAAGLDVVTDGEDRKSTRLNSSHRTNSYAVFCLKQKKEIKS